MGVKLPDVPKREITPRELEGKTLVVDAFNMIYQFVTTIRDRDTGDVLKDSMGRPTSHLSGLFYRCTNLLEDGVRLVFVFDGEKPSFKTILKEREERKKKAEEKLEEAKREGDTSAILKYAMQAARVTPEMIEDAKRLLSLMGIPWIQAPSEGEAQAAHMVKKGDGFAVASQDMDTLLFGGPRLVRNLSVTGRRKLAGRNVYIQVKPELIVLEEVLAHLEITREQLVTLGILVGTDYNPGGVPGLGPKKSLKLVKEEKEFDRVFSKVEWPFDVSPRDIHEFFMNPPVTDDYEIKFGKVDREGLIKFLVEERDFSRERVKKTIERLESIEKKGHQKTLLSFGGGQ